jgi:uncharacterized RDD family membrane protein YckC
MVSEIENNLMNASIGQRLLNFIIDTILLNIISYIEGYIEGRILIIDTIGVLCFSVMLTLIVIFLYYFLFEYYFQKTPGKFITRTKVVNANGSKPDIQTILKRSLIRFVPFDAISIYTGKDSVQQNTWWHDRWSMSRVIKDK